MFALRRLANHANRQAIATRMAIVNTSRQFHTVQLELNPNASPLDHQETTEFDGDAGEYVRKEVSVHDRLQTQLSDDAKDAARMADYEGDRHSAPFTSGQLDPAKLFEEYDPEKHDQAANKAIEEAESLRDA